MGGREKEKLRASITSSPSVERASGSRRCTLVSQKVEILVSRLVTPVSDEVTRPISGRGVSYRVVGEVDVGEITRQSDGAGYTRTPKQDLHTVVSDPGTIPDLTQWGLGIQFRNLGLH